MLHTGGQAAAGGELSLLDTVSSCRLPFKASSAFMRCRFLLHDQQRCLTIAGGVVAAGGRSAASLDNLFTHKQCPGCGWLYGNRMGSRQGGTVCTRGVEDKDAEGNSITRPCGFLILSNTQKDQKARKEAPSLPSGLLLPTKLPKLGELEASFTTFTNRV